MENLESSNTSYSNQLDTSINISSQGRAVPFVIISQNKFIIPDEAKEILTKSIHKNIGIISLVGKYRTGKSFLLNRVLLNRGKENGFDVGPTIRPCTKGIWLWSNPLLIQNNHNKEKFPAFLIDTEGLGAYNEEINHDSKIFLIAILISSLFIFNSFGNIDETSISSLSFILNLSKTIKIKSTSLSSSMVEDSELSKYFPSFLWLLRDFSLKLEDIEGNVITAKQYLENALQFQKGSSDAVEEKNKVRKLIKTYFPERDCFIMVRPVEDEKDLQFLQTLEDEKIRKEFLEQADVLRNKVVKKTRPKTFNSKFLTGSMLIELVQSVLDAINEGSIPVIENSWKYVVQNECMKNSNEALNEYVKKMIEYKTENVANPNFLQNFDKFSTNLQKSIIDNFQANTLYDESSAVEFTEKLKTKMNAEYKKFKDDNAKIFEAKFTAELEKNSKKLQDAFETDKYAKNYYSFFQDLENLKDITEASTPDFPNKKEIIYDKTIGVVKKFIEVNFLKNKIYNEKEITTVRNDFSSLTNKYTLKSQEFENFKQETKETIEKLNAMILDNKMKEKAIDDKVKAVENEKKIEKENYEKAFKDFKKENESKFEKLNVEKNKLENEIKTRDEQNLVQKLKDDKINALHDQKIDFLEKEVTSWKERYMIISKDYETLKKENEELKKEIDKLKTENFKLIELEKIQREQNANAIKNDVYAINNEANSNFKSILKEQLEQARVQLDENRKLYENFIGNLQNKNSQIESINEGTYKALLEENKTLTLSLGKSEARCTQLEEYFTKFKTYKGYIKMVSDVKCKFCFKLFSFKNFKTHSLTCQNDIMKNSVNALTQNSSSDKLKIKILTGLLNKDEVGKPYIEYIIDITYNTQNWRVNKKFNQFANLHKAIKSLFKNVVKMPESSSIFVNIHDTPGNSFHESKRQNLEKYLKELSEIEVITKSRPFRKFLEFEEYFDDEGERETRGKCSYGNVGNRDNNSNFEDLSDEEDIKRSSTPTPGSDAFKKDSENAREKVSIPSSKNKMYEPIEKDKDKYKTNQPSGKNQNPTSLEVTTKCITVRKAGSSVSNAIAIANAFEKPSIDKYKSEKREAVTAITNKKSNSNTNTNNK